MKTPDKETYITYDHTLLVGFENAHGDDVAVLVVGRKRKNQSVEVINAFQGQEAVDLWEKLSKNIFEEKGGAER